MITHSRTPVQRDNIHILLLVYFCVDGKVYCIYASGVHIYTGIGKRKKREYKYGNMLLYHILVNMYTDIYTIYNHSNLHTLVGICVHVHTVVYKSVLWYTVYRYTTPSTSTAERERESPGV